MKSVVKNKSEKYFSEPWLMSFVMFVFFCVILHIYLPNLGGVGLSLPLNIISDFSIALFILIVSIAKLKKVRVYYSTPSNFISIGLIILILLCLFSPSEYRYNAYLTACWIFGALVFYQLLLQVYISDKGCVIILWGLLISSVIESILAMMQVFNVFPITWLPYPPLSGERPYGIFQQVNVFSSFISVGIASALGLLIKIKNLSRLSYGFIMVCTIFMSTILPLSQSLTGYLSLFLIVFFLLVFIKYERRNIVQGSIAIIIGLIIGYGIKVGLNISDVSESKLQTSHIRWVLWQHSLYLFSDNFLWGSGVGSFESIFLERFGGDLLSASDNTMSHPHNEILLWMVEGGVIGLIAILFIMLGGFYLWRSSLKNGKIVYLIAALPIIFHMMTEFPLWISTPHGVALMLLLRCADVQQGEYLVSKPVAIFSKGLTATFGIVSIGLLYCTLQAQQYLTYIEKTGQQAILSKENLGLSKWNYTLLHDRYSFDLHMGYLLHYNETNDANYLQLFDEWAESYSRVHPDANVYFSWYLVLNALGKNEAAKKTYEKAKWLFNNDPRFE